MFAACAASFRSLSNLSFCIGSDDCSRNGTAFDDIVTRGSIADELGTSGPWERFLTNGGLLLLALFGTLCVRYCNSRTRSSRKLGVVEGSCVCGS